MYEMGEEEIEAVARVIRSGRLFRYGLKPDDPPTETAQLEREWSDGLGVAHSLSLSSGTAALISGLIGLGVEPGDEVIVPGYTFVSSPLAALAMGAVPVLAEVDATLTLDPNDVRNKVTSRTKAIMPVHVLGHVADLAPIVEIARSHRLHVLEDCAQAIGGQYRGRFAGSIGDAGAFSFNFFKILTAGEGGMLTTSHGNVIQRARVYHDNGIAWWPDARDIHVPYFGGVTYRMDEIRAALLRVQLQRLPFILERLHTRWARLYSLIRDVARIEPVPIIDEAGTCGTTLLLRVKDRAMAQTIASACRKRSLPVMLPYDMDRHLYLHWEPLLARRGAHHPAVDPLHITETGRSQQYTPDMLPNTLRHLEQTVALTIDIHWADDDLSGVAQAFREVVRSI